MKKITLFLLILAPLLHFSPAFADETPQPVKSVVAGAISVTQNEKKLGIFAIYAGDEALTKVLRAGLESKGYRIEADESKAPLHLVVTPIYMGDASGEPKIGSTDNTSSGLNLGRLIWRVLYGKAAGLDKAYFASGIDAKLAALYWSDVASGTIRTSNWTYSNSPIDALVVKLDFTSAGKAQSAQVATESYAENLPKEELVKENLRMVMWFME